ncbi:MAG: 4Fe-4S binding protein, partial [Planctomycetota bacterium]
RPTVHEDVCVGCGMCEEACIVDRDKAIRVHSDRSWS